MSLSETWDALVSTAVLGTDRRSPHLTEPLLQSLVLPQNAEAHLLTAASLLAPMRRAAAVPPLLPASVPDAAPPETLPVVSAVAAERLRALLENSMPRSVLLEWFSAATRQGKRVPHRMLADLLEVLRAQPHWSDAMLPALGARARWLAARNPLWEAFDDRPEAWPHAARTQRVHILRALRRKDPGAARTLLESTKDDRDALLVTMLEGLSMADEPFLESCLDERRKDTREAAASLLSRLPESLLVQRIASRIDPSQPPEALDDALSRDGISSQGAPPELGPRGWWLLQMIGRVPPSRWGDPEPTIGEALASNWAVPRLEGYATAAVRFRDERWAEALLRTRPPGLRLGGLLSALSQEARERHLSEDLNQTALLEARFPWSLSFTRLVLQHLRREAESAAASVPWKVHSFVVSLAGWMDPHALDEAQTVLRAPEDSPWGGTFFDVVTLLRFRHDMHEEIATP